LFRKRDENREVYPSWKQPAEEEHFFDGLGKGLANGSISRGRALRLVGAALLGLAVLPSTPLEAQARRRRHRGGGGGGNACNNPGTCNHFEFGGACSRDCACAQDADGRNVCVGRFDCPAPNNSTNFCNRDRDCRSGEACIVNSCCRTGNFRGVCAPQCS
jgi:hypothetical protein